MSKKKPAARLYVAGPKDALKWAIAPFLEDVSDTLGPDTRVPDPDDIRVFWEQSGIADMTDAERVEKFKVSRQTVHNWRLKGGGDLLRRSEKVARDRDARIRQVLTTTPNISASIAAEHAHVRIEHVRRIAREMGLTLARNRKMPPNDELLRLAAGKTWRELADAVGVCLQSLRTYVYKDKALAEAMRAVRKPAPSGAAAHGKLPIEKIIRMGKRGMTAYAIAEALKLEHMTVRACLKRWEKEQASVNERKARRQLPSGDSVAGSDGGDAMQQG